MCHSFSKAIVAGALAIVTAVAAQSALAKSGLTFRAIRVDVSPFRATPAIRPLVVRHGFETRGCACSGGQG